jgi:hypothetical protein
MENSFKSFEKLVAGNPEETRQMLLPLFDTLYRLCASNPNFNAKTGESRVPQLVLLQ